METRFHTSITPAKLPIIVSRISYQNLSVFGFLQNRLRILNVNWNSYTDTGIGKINTQEITTLYGLAASSALRGIAPAG